MKMRYLSVGLSDYVTNIIVNLEEETSKGSEETLWNNTVQELTGKSPLTLEDWVNDHKSIWE